jgi:hypothetical protein
MKRTIWATAAAALLASAAIFVAFDDAEARGGRGGGGGIHRMGGRAQLHSNHGNRARHVNIARGGAVHGGLGARGRHVGGVQRRPQVSKALHAGTTMRHGGNFRQLSQRNTPALNPNPLNSRNNFPALNNHGGSSTRSANLVPGPRSLQNQPQGRTYREMGMGSTPNTQPQANNTPQNQNPINKPQYNPAKELLTNWGNEFINQIPQVALPSATPGTVYSAGGAIKTFVSPPPIEYIKASKNCLQTGVCVRPNPAGLAITSFIDPRSSTLVNVGVDVLTPDPRLGGKAKLDVGGAAAVQGGAAMVDPIGTVKRQLGGNLPAAWGDLK